MASRMQKPMSRTPIQRRKNGFSVESFFKKIVDFFKHSFFNPEYFWTSGCFFLVAEIVVCSLAIRKVPYTEIDWKAYMQQVEGFVSGVRDYTKLNGDTGPLVYPAGHLYLYTLLYYATDLGTNIKRAQYIFACLYILTLVVVFRIYRKCNIVPPYVLLFMCATAYRVHSIYILRLFNDPIAVTLFYSSTLLFLNDWWLFGCLVYSLAVSVKMNILLFAPALFVLLIIRKGYVGTFFHLALCGLVQLVLAAPFLIENPLGYVFRAFNLGRIFMYKWTVNWRFIPADLFVNKYFHISLLAAHLVFLLIFAFKLWLRQKKGLKVALLSKERQQLSANEIVFALFTCNFIGIMFSRTLHYQFYVWYFHSLPYLLWSANRCSVMTKLAILGVIEFCWNTYPSTNLSSLALHLCHIVLFLSFFLPERKRSEIRPKKID